MKSFVLAISFTALLLCVRAQDRVLRGYIVKSSGDTLRGVLKEQGSDESTKQISFKASATDKEYQIYTPDQVKSYQYDGGNLFRAVTYTDTRAASVTRTCYGKLLVTGEYDLYCFSESGALYFLVRKDNNYRLLYDDDRWDLEFGKGNFRNELNFLASGCNSMANEVGRAAYTIGGLTAFFQQLDACLSPHTPVLTYYHEPKGYSGFYAYMGGIAYGSRAQFTVEVAWRKVWPQVDPSLSLNIGLRFTNLVKPIRLTIDQPFSQGAYQIASIPVTVQYNILKGNFQPFVYAGLSLMTEHLSSDVAISADEQPVGLVIGGGVEVKIKRCLWVRAEWRSEYLSQFPTVGLAVILP